MYDNYNYPMGADTPDAPWNQEDLYDYEDEAVEALEREIKEWSERFSEWVSEYFPNAPEYDLDRLKWYNRMDKDAKETCEEDFVEKYKSDAVDKLIEAEQDTDGAREDYEYERWRDERLERSLE